MGISDKFWVKLTCPSCNATDTVSVNDKGNSFGGASWGVPTSDAFDLTGTGGGKTEPEVTSATCKQCGTAAVVESRFGFGRPSGF